MTPLAYSLLKGLTGAEELKIAGPRLEKKHLWWMLSDARYFDLTAVMPLVFDLAKKLQADFEGRRIFDDRLAFLPARKVWIEALDPAGNRRAYFLRGNECCTESADFSIVFRREPGWEAIAFPCDLPLVGSTAGPVLVSQSVGKPYASGDHFVVYAALAIINSPRVIGQRQHQPHRRIERDLLSRVGLRGKFAVHAWTEIILRVTPPADKSGVSPREAHLTGQRCLHFCRTYLRVRMGRLEIIPGHWRGDASLGIKRSRYVLKEAA